MQQMKEHICKTVLFQFLQTIHSLCTDLPLQMNFSQRYDKSRVFVNSVRVLTREWGGKSVGGCIDNTVQQGIKHQYFLLGSTSNQNPNDEMTIHESARCSE
jgi:hypothetical protein